MGVWFVYAFIMEIWPNDLRILMHLFSLQNQDLFMVIQCFRKRLVVEIIKQQAIGVLWLGVHKRRVEPNFHCLLSAV